ncbi:MAG: hypothetical protein ACYCT1_08385 [Steroidobacteraceae bacterium]
MLKQWKAPATVAAATAFAPPDSGYVPRFLGIRNLSALSGTEASVFETGVASGGGGGSNGQVDNGQVTVDPYTQQIVAGDEILAGMIVVVDLVTEDEAVASF